MEAAWRFWDVCFENQDLLLKKYPCFTNWFERENMQIFFLSPTLLRVYWCHLVCGSGCAYGLHVKDRKENSICIFS
jgi:hypothetical protein